MTTSRKQRDLSLPSKEVSAHTTCTHPKQEVGSRVQPDTCVFRTLRMVNAPFAAVHGVEDLHIGQGGEQLFPVRPRRPSWSLSPAAGGKNNNRWCDGATVWRKARRVGGGRDPVRSSCVCGHEGNLKRTHAPCTILVGYLNACTHEREPMAIPPHPSLSLRCPAFLTHPPKRRAAPPRAARRGAPWRSYRPGPGGRNR